MNNDMLKSVKDLCSNSWLFRIPYYQRGYRWKSQQVKQLLEDLNTFRSSEETPFYFLQALAITKDGNECRVVDGQQRLTTLSLILEKVSARNSIRMKYDREANGAIDQYYKSMAANSIDIFLSSQPENWLSEFAEKVLGAHFLVYEVPKDEESATFARLNSGKIKATDSELVKCIMLTPQGDEPMEVTSARVAEWDYMERTLNDGRFHAFLARRNTWKAEDRMTLIFRYAGFIPTKTQQKNETNPFLSCVEQELKEWTRVEVWRKIAFTFSQVRDWFLRPITYHAVGWYVHCGFADSTRPLILPDVAGKMKELVDQFMDKSNDPSLFFNDQPYARRILLLFNAAWCWKRGDRLYDWGGHREVETWSLEHIFARNQKDLTEAEFKEFCHGCEEADWLRYQKAKEENKGNDYLAEVLRDVYPKEEDHSLWNLALAGRNTNSALNNSLFADKSAKLDERIVGKVEFVPPATEAVFHKQFPKMSVGVRYFSEDDKKAYLKFMKETINSFMKELANHV